MKWFTTTFGKIILSCAVTAVLTLATSLVLYYITTKEASLKYEVLPIAKFQRDSVEVSIVNIRIVNDGRKECENVVFAPSFGSRENVNKYGFEKSSEGIAVNELTDSITGKRFYVFPYLNPKDQVVCSFLLNKVVDESEIKVSLRSRGITGENFQGVEELSLTLFFLTIGALVLAIGMIVFIIFHQRKVIRYQLMLHRKEYDRMKQKVQLIESYKELLEEHKISHTHISDTHVDSSP